MRRQLGAAALLTVAVVYSALLLLYAVAFFVAGGLVASLLGVSALALLVVGLYVLYAELRFVRQAEGLRAAAGDLSGSAAASPAFQDVTEAVQAAPEDWRRWMELAEAYRRAGDRSAARRTMQQAISLAGRAGSKE